MKKPVLYAAYLFLLLYSNYSLAYRFTEDFISGSFWQSLPVHMNVYALESSKIDIFQNILNSTEEEWESATGSDMWSFGNVILGNGDDGNFIKWSSNFSEETGYDAASTLGVTIRYSQGMYFEKVIIIFNANLAYLYQNFNNALKKTMLHELGHTLGLGHSDDASAIMYYQISTTQSLQPDDQDGMLDILDQTYSRQVTGYRSSTALGSSNLSEKILSCSSSMAFAGDGNIGIFYGFIHIILIFLGIICGISTQRVIISVFKKFKY